MKYLADLTADRLKEVLSYDKNTGEFFWIKSLSHRINIGEKAGTYRNNGYTKISLDGKPYFCHRLAWLYVYGNWPKENIDHINNIKDDNRIENLREASQSQNNMNRASYGTKVCVAKGVYKYKGRFAVRVSLGTYDTAEEAIKISQNFYKNFQKQFVHASVSL